jgi:hypothetical protein
MTNGGEMGWQSHSDQGAGDKPGRDPKLPVVSQASGPGSAPACDSGSGWDACPPSAALAAAVEAASGPEWRCPGATDDELTGVLGRWAALESWAAAGKLGVIREMIRRESPSLLSGGRHGDLPDAWGESLGHELALALGLSVQSADATALLAWDLQARLPGVGAKLADGTLSYLKAMLITKELSVLSEDDAAKAEALVLGQLVLVPGMTPGQLARLAAQAAVTIDPDGAQRRREVAEKLDIRVRLWREQSGAAALAGRNLPADEALAAYASVNARTGQYKKSKAFPDASMDQLRAMAYLDLLNGVTASDRIANAQVNAAVDGRGGEPAATRADSPAREDEYGGEGSDEEGPDGGGPDDGGPGGLRPGDGPCGSGPVSDEHLGQPPRTDLVIPLLTLLGRAERPGESHGLGPLDPALCRDLAATAANSLRSEWCLTVTDVNGFAIAHGCARLGVGDKATRKAWLRQAGVKTARLGALPSQVNLTISASALSSLAAEAGGWGFAPRDGTGMPVSGSPQGRNGGRPETRGISPPATNSPTPIQLEDFGTWTLTLPGGRTLAVKIEPVPTYDCDHGHESHAYEANDTLRHLVQVRDGNCTFPPCSRHARETDFEHAIPHHKGGRTCACNAGARSRKCHRIKQSPGWDVTQPRPGWHRWTTPSGRVYTQEPKRYPA